MIRIPSASTNSRELGSAQYRKGFNVSRRHGHPARGLCSPRRGGDGLLRGDHAPRLLTSRARASTRQVTSLRRFSGFVKAPELARTAGVNVRRVDLVLSIGIGLRYLRVLLMGAMLIVPAATATGIARNLCQSLTLSVSPGSRNARTRRDRLTGEAETGPVIVLVAGGGLLLNLLVSRGTARLPALSVCAGGARDNSELSPIPARRSDGMAGLAEFARDVRSGALVAWLVENLLCLAELDQLASARLGVYVHECRTVRNALRLLQVVRHDQKGDALP